MRNCLKEAIVTKFTVLRLMNTVSGGKDMVREAKILNLKIFSIVLNIFSRSIAIVLRFIK